MEVKIHPILGIAVREDGAVYLDGKNNRWKPHWSYGYKNSDGYRKVRIKGKAYSIHRLVAECYIPNPEDKPQVDHINRNREDNRMDNLRWATPYEQSMNCSIHLNSSIPVLQRDDPNGYRRAYNALNREKVRKYQREYHREYDHKRRKAVA